MVSLFSATLERHTGFLLLDAAFYLHAWLGRVRACVTPLHLYEEMKRVCANMLMTGERVLYFHLGYMEKVMRQAKIQSQKLANRDLHGCGWRFSHIYRGQPTWTFVPGDEFHFLRKEGGGLHPYVDAQRTVPTVSLMSSQDIHACW